MTQSQSCENTSCQACSIIFSAPPSQRRPSQAAGWGWPGAGPGSRSTREAPVVGVHGNMLHLLSMADKEPSTAERCLADTRCGWISLAVCLPLRNIQTLSFGRCTEYLSHSPAFTFTTSLTGWNRLRKTVMQCIALLYRRLTSSGYIF